MPLSRKRKRMGFLGTPSWKKKKVGENSSSSSSIPRTPELFNSNQSEETSDSASAQPAHSVSYRKIYGAEGSDSEEDDLESTDHELDCEGESKVSDADPTGFRLIDMELLTTAISHTICEQCKCGKQALQLL